MSARVPDVRQYVPVLFPRDAVGNHALATRRALRRAGMSGRTWAEHYDPRLALSVRRCRGHGHPPPSARTVLLYQASTGSEGMADLLLRLPGQLAIYYHNITPSRFFGPYDGVAAGSMRRGARELRALIERTALAFAASEYSAAELRELGVRDVRHMPPYYPASVGRPASAYLDRLRRTKRGVDLLFVGRLAPHKGQLDLIRAAAVLRSGLGRPVRLFLVGAEGPHNYLRAIRYQIDRLGMRHAVVMTGLVSQAQLAAHYQAADAFVCLSEHEGFGIPVLEAMRAGLPVLARDAAAVGETLGGAGVLLGDAAPLLVAETIARVLADEPLRDQLVLCQRRRAAAVDAFDRDAVLLSAMRELADR
ncbi:MAG TPA: glycosyltransferase family 4 protein [Candidatus Dormibacteraeota bacterium]|nr:glycosyltransferase family 4 protein [Candidatus Dormibacteraeota bacterium]